MIIVNRKEFLKLPPNTLFSEYEPCVFGPLMIKMETSQEVDYYEQSIADAIDCSGSSEFVDFLTAAAEDGKELEMDFDCIGRNGSFDEDDKLYAIYGPADVLRLRARLLLCI